MGDIGVPPHCSDQIYRKRRNVARRKKSQCWGRRENPLCLVPTIQRIKIPTVKKEWIGMCKARTGVQAQTTQNGGEATGPEGPEKKKGGRGRSGGRVSKREDTDWRV